ncbi:hypothetical protein GCM10027035_47680 [Emticicia sediminis]
MRITSVNIPKNIEDNDGLEDIKMQKLQEIVLIAGKNGSGKSRILKKVFEKFTKKMRSSTFSSLNDSLDGIKRELSESNQRRLALEKIDPVEYQEVISVINNKILELESSFRQIHKALIENIKTDTLAEVYRHIYFVPKKLILSDSDDYTKKQLMISAENVNLVGIESLPEGVYAKIQVIQDRWWNSTHQNSNIEQHEKENAIDAYRNLEEMISIFLNTKITRNLLGQAQLFGFPLGQSKLSDGQIILLQFCLAIYSQGYLLNDLILVLDEPENHLHPSVIIETIERLQKHTTHGQIWIATHSIPLLAHFDPSLIWYVEDGKIEHAGKIPEKVLESLLGSEDEILKLQDFISLPAQLATSRYAVECLFEPKAVITGPNDPQSLQIKAEVLSLCKTDKLRILDYGAGKGRLISNITDLDENQDDKLISKIEYIAFDKFPDDKEICELALTKAYGDCKDKYFNNSTDLLSVYDEGSFDVIIMCNVLHEIDPKEWLRLFRKNGEISSLLSEKGILLLVEDHQIPIGEKAYQNGFIILDTPQIKDLFKIQEKEAGFKFSDAKGNGRLKAHQIPKSYLERIDENSRLKAIKSLSEIAKGNILNIRTKEKKYNNGKLHGFWTQQFANSNLVLSELSSD